MGSFSCKIHWWWVSVCDYTHQAIILPWCHHPQWSLTAWLESCSESLQIRRATRWLQHSPESLQLFGWCKWGQHGVGTLPVPPVAVRTRKSSNVLAYASSFRKRFTNELDSMVFACLTRKRWGKRSVNSPREFKFHRASFPSPPLQYQPSCCTSVICPVGCQCYMLEGSYAQLQVIGVCLSLAINPCHCCHTVYTTDDKQWGFMMWHQKQDMWSLLSANAYMYLIATACIDTTQE